MQKENHDWMLLFSKFEDQGPSMYAFVPQSFRKLHDYDQA